MAWCRIGDKPLPETLLTQFIDTYMRHWVEISWRILTGSKHNDIRQTGNTERKILGYRGLRCVAVMLNQGSKHKHIFYNNKWHKVAAHRLILAANWKLSLISRSLISCIAGMYHSIWMDPKSLCERIRGLDYFTMDCRVSLSFQTLWMALD